jgi:hypothetical protein
VPPQLLPGGYFGLLFRFQLEDNLPLLIPRPKIPVDLKGIKRLLLRDVFDDFEDLFRRKTFDESISSCTGQSCVGDSREHSRRSWRCSERSAP